MSPLPPVIAAGPSSSPCLHPALTVHSQQLEEHGVQVVPAAPGQPPLVLGAVLHQARDGEARGRHSRDQPESGRVGRICGGARHGAEEV